MFCWSGVFLLVDPVVGVSRGLFRRQGTHQLCHQALSIARLDLSLLDDTIDESACISYAGQLDDTNPLSACMSGRLPPMTPDRVKFELVNNKVFTNKSDVDKVAKLYKIFFDFVSSSVTELQVMDSAMPKGADTHSPGK